MKLHCFKMNINGHWQTDNSTIVRKNPFCGKCRIPVITCWLTCIHKFAFRLYLSEKVYNDKYYAHGKNANLLLGLSAISTSTYYMKTTDFIVTHANSKPNICHLNLFNFLSYCSMATNHPKQEHDYDLSEHRNNSWRLYKKITSCISDSLKTLTS